MIRDDLWSRASEIAERDYRVEYEWDELSEWKPYCNGDQSGVAWLHGSGSY